MPAPAGGPRIRIFLLDDHEIVRRGIRELLEAESDLTVVGEASTAREAVARIPAVHPHVAVLDVRLPDGDGVSVCREVRATLPDVACLILTAFAGDETVRDAALAGAAGYLLKQIRGTELVHAVRTVATGRSLLDPRATARLTERLRPPEPAPTDPITRLSPQERSVLDLIGDGLTNRQIADRMYLTEKTVKNYVSRLLAKLGVPGRVPAALYARERRRDR